MIELASDNSQLLARWNTALSDEPEKHLVGSYEELISSLENNQIEMVMVHMNLPGSEGLKGIENIIKTFPDLRLLVLSDKPNELEGLELLQHGILGYANSYISINYLKQAIKVIKLGEVWVGKSLMQWLLANCINWPKSSANSNYINLDSLTVTERKVSSLLGKANNNKVIAKELGITERTVKAHLSSIFRKTGVSDRLHLMLLLNGNQK